MYLLAGYGAWLEFQATPYPATGVDQTAPNTATGIDQTAPAPSMVGAFGARLRAVKRIVNA